ncbi:hypothetical protein [Flavobacterium sp. W21_SRS_FM6]|uniref:hypothetical protein n=1 Tax=Flavobacterium sp. W21_SRS_FM6 TaxID=3240268 RepID=UPI003F9040CC
MHTSKLPDSIRSLVEELQIVEVTWQGVPIQVPKFAIYAILSMPLFDRVIFQNGRQIGLLQFGRYTIPVLDPFKANVDPSPKYAVIMSHSRDNLFGLYAYTADHIESGINLPIFHGSVSRIVKAYI